MVTGAQDDDGNFESTAKSREEKRREPQTEREILDVDVKMSYSTPEPSQHTAVNTYLYGPIVNGSVRPLLGWVLCG